MISAIARLVKRAMAGVGVSISRVKRLQFVVTRSCDR